MTLSEMIENHFAHKKAMRDAKKHLIHEAQMQDYYAKRRKETEIINQGKQLGRELDD